MIKLPKAALIACNKNELISLAVQYNVTLKEEATKAEIIDLILKAQDAPQTEKKEVPAVPVEGGIKVIRQEVGQG